jgi:hypothetical protein
MLHLCMAIGDPSSYLASRMLTSSESLEANNTNEGIIYNKIISVSESLLYAKVWAKCLAYIF